MSDETRNNENNFFENKVNNDNSVSSQDDSVDNNTVETSFDDASTDILEATPSETCSTSPAPFDEGFAYTKNVDGTTANGYEWNAQNASIYTPSSKASKKKSSDKGFKVFLSAILSVFTVSVVALTVMVIGYINNSDNNVDNAKSNSSQKNTSIQTSEQFNYDAVTLENPNYVAFDFKDYENGDVLSIPEIAAKCSPSSVGIVSQVEITQNYSFFFGGSSSQLAEASGSGFIYSADGYIITNHHVIEDAKKVTVILHDGEEYEAEIVGSDSLSDIAVLKIEPKEETTLVPMEIGNSDQLVVGEPVVAIGCPAGIEFIGTVTDGIISSINRNVELTDDYGSQKTMALIQTNATINHGNSGGPLINSRGQVIGINTLKLSSNYEGIGFSIPMNGAVPIITQLIEHGEVIERTEEDFVYGKGIIGINGSAISETESEYYGIPQGVLVVQIDRDSSAARAGLRRGDIITHYNGKEVKTVDDINNAKNSARAGTEVTVTVYRDGVNGNDGQSIDITFKLDSQE